MTPGDVVASRYAIVSEIGAGGMGTVYRAHDRKLDQDVALKFLRDARPDQAAAQRFRSEIKLAWRVRHRNVCGIHEYGEDGDLVFISMELVEGRDLRRILKEDGPLVWEAAFDVLIQASEGLQAIHQAGVIHRDLKPANIIVDAHGLVRVMDFGIAKLWGEQHSGELTGSGHVVGSPAYMSPEQVLHGRDVGFACDLYAMGIVMYEVFTGKVPFRGATPAATMLKQVDEPLRIEGPSAARIPAAVVPVIRKALAKEPSGRYVDCDELLHCLRAARAALGRQVTDDLPAPGVPRMAALGFARGALLPAKERTDPRNAAPSSSAVVPGSRSFPPEALLLVPTLIRALRHAEPTVRATAAATLGRIGMDKRSLAPLSEAERDTDERVRAAAAVALGELRPASGHSASQDPPDWETPGWSESNSRADDPPVPQRDHANGVAHGFSAATTLDREPRPPAVLPLGAERARREAQPARTALPRLSPVWFVALLLAAVLWTVWLLRTP